LEAPRLLEDSTSSYDISDTSIAAPNTPGRQRSSVAGPTGLGTRMRPGTHEKEDSAWSSRTNASWSYEPTTVSKIAETRVDPSAAYYPGDGAKRPHEQEVPRAIWDLLSYSQHTPQNHHDGNARWTCTHQLRYFLHYSKGNHRLHLQETFTLYFRQRKASLYNHSHQGL
jgi:hypothetical protein